MSDFSSGYFALQEVQWVRGQKFHLEANLDNQCVQIIEVRMMEVLLVRGQQFHLEDNLDNQCVQIIEVRMMEVLCRQWTTTVCIYVSIASPFLEESWHIVLKYYEKHSYLHALQAKVTIHF